MYNNLDNFIGFALIVVILYAFIKVVRFSIREHSEYRPLNTPRTPTPAPPTADVNYEEMTDPSYVETLLRTAYGSELDEAEQKVAAALNHVRLSTYVLFNNVVLASHSGNTPHTQIDHILVSTSGIFCIETKSHKGAIYGSASSKRQHWYQYLNNGQRYEIYNPTLQNYRHVQALKELLGTNIKVPIHAYTVFPNAYKIKTDSPTTSNNIQTIIAMIERHQSTVYDLPTYHRILKSLVYASSDRKSLAHVHRQEVQAYLTSSAKY